MTQDSTCNLHAGIFHQRNSDRIAHGKRESFHHNLCDLAGLYGFLRKIMFVIDFTRPLFQTSCSGSEFWNFGLVVFFFLCTIDLLFQAVKKSGDFGDELPDTIE